MAAQQMKSQAEALAALGRKAISRFAFLVLFAVACFSCLHVHQRSYGNELRYSRIAEGNISHYVAEMWRDGWPSFAGLVRDDAHLQGRVRPAHWLFQNVPFAVTILRNGDFFRGDWRHPARKINGDLQTHTVCLLVTLALALAGTAYAAYCLLGSFWVALGLCLFLPLSHSVGENLLVNFSDSQEIPQLFWIGLYAALIAGTRSIHRRVGLGREILATLCAILAYTTKETTVVIAPIFVCLFGWELWKCRRRPGSSNRGVYVRQVLVHCAMLVAILVAAYRFRHGAYVADNYTIHKLNWLAQLRFGFETLTAGIDWGRPGLASLFLCLALLAFPTFRRRIATEWKFRRWPAIVSIWGLCAGFCVVILPWKPTLAKYYLPVAFYGTLGTLGLAWLMSRTFRRAGFGWLGTAWALGVTVFMLAQVNTARGKIRYYYREQYASRAAVPVIARDIAIEARRKTPPPVAVHIVAEGSFPEGALPFQRQVNLLRGINVYQNGEPVRKVEAVERNYFRRYSRSSGASIALTETPPSNMDADIVYAVQKPDSPSGIDASALKGFVRSREWDIPKRVRIVKYTRIP